MLEVRLGATHDLVGDRVRSHVLEEDGLGVVLAKGLDQWLDPPGRDHLGVGDREDPRDTDTLRVRSGHEAGPIAIEDLGGHELAKLSVCGRDDHLRLPVRCPFSA